jgi:hypothetical protein
LEELILNELKLVFEDKIEIKFIDNKKNDNSELSILKFQLLKIEDQEIRIKEAYRNGIDTLEEYKENKDEIKKSKQLLENKIDELSKPALKENIKKVRENAKTIYEILNDDKIDMNKKYEYIHLLIEKCIFNKQEKTLAIYFRKEYTKNN